MTCDEAREAFSDLYDGLMAAGPTAALDRHLEGCPACRAEWAAFREAVRAVTELESVEPFPGFAARVRQRVEAPPWWQRAIRWLFVPLRVKLPIQALAMALVAFAAVLMYQRSPEVRRAAESPVSPPPPVVRQTPLATPAPAAPPAADRGSRGIEGAKPRTDASKTERPQSSAPPAGAGAPLSRAPMESEKERGSAPPREESKERAKKMAPLEAPEVAEPSRESAAKSAETSQLGPKLPQSAPAPVETPKALQGSGRASPQAPAKRDQLSSIPTGSADELYSAAQTDLVHQSYDRAINGFRSFIAQHPRDARIPDARVRMADAYFAQHRYAEAIPEYEALIRQFPDSPLVPAALYRQGQARLALGDRAGCRVLRGLVDRYPQAPETALAKDALSARCP